jgi:hypothetical protein
MQEVVFRLDKIIEILSGSSWISTTVSTLSGLIVGAFLTYFFQTFGSLKLKLGTRLVQYFVHTSDAEGIFGKKAIAPNKEWQLCEYRITISIYNSSLVAKNISNLRLYNVTTNKITDNIFYDNQKTDSSGSSIQKPFTFENIDGHKFETFKLICIIHDRSFFSMSDNKIKILYNSNMRKKEITLDKKIGMIDGPLIPRN